MFGREDLVMLYVIHILKAKYLFQEGKCAPQRSLQGIADAIYIVLTLNPIKQ